jgi:hypothetical protein
MTLSTGLRGMTKNLSFSHFWAIFVSYCPQFWVFGVIFKATGMTKNSSFLRLWPFCDLFRTVLGFWGIYMAHDTQYMFERHDQKLVIFTFLGHFCELLSTILGFWGDFQVP